MNHPTRFYPKEVHGSTDPSYNNTLRPGDKPSEYSHRHHSNPQHNVPYSSDNSTHEHMPRYSRYGSTDPSYQNTLRPGDKRHPYSHLHHTDPKSVHVTPQGQTGPYEKYGNNDPGYNKTFPSHRQNVTSSLSKLHTKVAKLESTLQNLNDFN